MSWWVSRYFISLLFGIQEFKGELQLKVSTCSQKMFQIITNASFEKKIKNTLKELGISGYTAFDVRGDGDTGFQGGHIEGDTNVLLMVLLSKDQSEALMSTLDSYIKKGYHIMVFSVDAEVLSSCTSGDC
jgi:nitrogen regulatory protein PII